MVAGLSQRETLSRALQALASKDPFLFENILWLDFGDDWKSVLQSLERRQIIRYVAPDDSHVITPEGRRVLGVLRQAGHGLDQPQADQQQQSRKA